MMSQAQVRRDVMLALTDDRAYRLSQCEEVIGRGLETFYEVGKALLTVRDEGLYKEAGCKTFEEYCQKRWQITRPRAYQLMDAARVAGNLSTIVDKPTNEAQTRELAPLDAEAQRAVWQIAQNTAPRSGDGRPLVTAAHIKSVTQVLTEVVRTGGLDDGEGVTKPLGALVDAAVTEETYERLMRQKEHIRASIENRTPENGFHAVAGMDRKSLAAANSGNGTEGDEWNTPLEYVAAAREVMGGIDVDPATNAAAQAKVEARTFYTAQDDGLTKKWRGRVWLNPPYSYPLIEQFTRRALEQYAAGNISAALILVNNCTDAAWFHALIERFPVCFTRGRVPFWRPGQTSFATRQGQAIFYMGSDVGRFVEVFSHFGVVVSKVG